jgi:hypothetical protein
VLHALASTIAWTIAVAIGLAFLGLLLRLLRVIFQDSVGKPGLRALMLAAVGFGAVVLWSASRVVP